MRIKIRFVILGKQVRNIEISLLLSIETCKMRISTISVPVLAGIALLVEYSFGLPLQTQSLNPSLPKLAN